MDYHGSYTATCYVCVSNVHKSVHLNALSMYAVSKRKVTSKQSLNV